MGAKEIHNDLGGLGPFNLDDTVKSPPAGLMIPSQSPQIRIGSIGSTWFAFADQVPTTATSASAPSAAYLRGVNMPCKWIAPWHINLYRDVARELAQGTYRLEKFYGNAVTCHASRDAALAVQGNTVAFQLNYSGLNLSSFPALAGRSTDGCNWIGAPSWGACSSDGEEIGPVPSLTYFLLRDPNAVSERRILVSDWDTGGGQNKALFDLALVNTSRYVPNTQTAGNANGLQKGILQIGLNNLRPDDFNVGPLLEQEIGQGNAVGARFTLLPSCCVDEDCNAYYSYLHWLPGGAAAYPECNQTDPLRGIIADTAANDTTTRSKCYWCPDWITSSSILSDTPRMDALGISNPAGRPYTNRVALLLALTLRHRLLELRLYDLDNIDETGSEQELVRELAYVSRTHGFVQAQPYGATTFQNSSEIVLNPNPTPGYNLIYQNADAPCPEPRVQYTGPVISSVAGPNTLARSYSAQLPAFSHNISANPFAELFTEDTGLLPPRDADGELSKPLAPARHDPRCSSKLTLY